MSSSYSNLKFELITTGEQSGSWGATTNTNLGTAIEQAIVGMATLTSADFSTNVATLTLTNTNAAQNARALCLVVSAGSLSAAGTINVPAIQKPYLIINNDSYTVTVKVAGLTGVSVPTGKRTVVYNNGTDVGNQIDYLASLTLGTALPIASGGTGSTSTTFVNLATNVTGTLPVANGGTGATTSTGSGANVLATSPTLVTPLLGTPTSGNLVNCTFPTLNQNTTGTASNVTGTVAIANGGSGATTAAAARTGFGATTIGSNMFTLTNPSAVTFPQFNADNTISALTAASFRTAIGAGSGSGSVTSVGTSGSVNGITLTGGPITGSGTITLGGTLANVSLTTQVTGTLPVANGGTGGTTSTGSGAVVLATSPSLVTPLLGTPTSGNLANCTFPTLNQNTTGTAANVTGVVAIANGGSGASTGQAAMNAFAGAVTSGSYLRGNGTNVVMSTIQAGDVPTLNQNTTGTASNVTGIVAVANGGTGTTTPSLVAGTNVTISGTWPNQTINSSGGGGGGSVTSVNVSGGTTGLTTSGGPITSSGTITIAGTLGIGNGGTGATTAATAITALTGTQTAGRYLRSDGTNAALSAIQAADVPTLNQNTTGTAAGLSSTLAVSSGGTGATTATAALTNLGAYPASNPNGYTTSTGTVTSVSGSGSVSGLSLSGTVTTSGNITLSGTLAVSATDFSSQAAKSFLAAPNAAAGVPSFRTIVAADIPTLNQNTSGTAANVTGTVAIANGGTGTTTAQLAINALAGAVTTGNYLRGNGTNVVMSAIQAADVPTLNQNTTGTAAGLSTTLAVASGGTGVTTSTGTGSVVLSNSPSLSTPALGTPSSGNLANCTFPTLNQNTTGSSSSISNSGGWSVTPSGTKLYFNYNGTNVGSLDSSGNFIAAGNVTAYGTP
jgi:hypothetical protein